MAKDINKYAQNIARARYARPSYTAPQRRATIDPSALSGRKAATGAPLASRPIEGGPALPSPQEYNPIIDAESGEDPNAPRVETQQPIENRGSSARYMLQTGGPRLDLSFLVPERANPNYDPNKAIGGENVPYQESKGIGGFFRRMLGDESNRMNIEAQQAQGAEWRAEEKAAKQRAERKQDLEDEIALREKGPQRRFDIEQKRLADKAIQDEIERQNAIDLALLKEGNEDIFRDIDMARKEVAADQDRQLRERQVKVTEDLAKRPRYKTIQTEKGGATVIDEDTGKPIRTFHPPGVGNIKDPITGKDVIGMVPGRWEEYERPTMPKNLGGAQVDRATGATMGGRLPAEADKPAASATIPTSPRNTIMPISEDATRTSRKVPIPEEESIDPYQLQRTTPSMGTMIEPAGSSVSNRARYMSTNMSGWRVEPQAPAPIIPGPIPASLSMASAAKKPAVDGTIEYPTVMGDSSVGPFRGPVQSLPLPQGPENLNVSQQYYSNLLQSADPNDVEYTNWLKEKLRNARF